MTAAPGSARPRPRPPTTGSVPATPTPVGTEPTTLRERLAERAATTSVQVIVGAIFMNLALGLALFVAAALLGSLLLMIAAAWLLVPMGVNVYLLCVAPDPTR